MRVLQVIHQFPPFSSQGSEVYCLNLAKQLQTSNDVRVFHVSNTAPRWPRRLMRASHEGLATYHCIDGAEYSRLAEWPNAFLGASFKSVLTEYAPDIVHFHHYLSLADDLVSAARAYGSAVVYTLHDFGLICPNSLLLRTDGKLCGRADPDFFQDCCPVLVRTGSAAARVVTKHLPSLARWRIYANHRGGAAGVPLRAGVALAERWLGDPISTDVERKRGCFLTHTRRIFADTDLFFAPSHFLRDRFVSCGLPSGKIRVARCGLHSFQPLPKAPTAGRISFGYIGALHPHKGIELLLNAFSGLGDHADLHIYGSAFGSPISEGYLARIADQHTGHVTFHGKYDNRRIDSILASLDAVVVPSLWYENSPLTIQEAFMGGVPVITADRGGMAELVRNGVDGLHFRLGDVASLRQTLRSVIDRPGLLAELRRNIPKVPDIVEQAAGVRAQYERLLSGRRASLA
jgi:glycosyltransferase involved in cell wall biosynthesis